MSLRILLVEHDDELREEYLRYFERLSYRFLGVRTAAQCVDQLERFWPDALVAEPEGFTDEELQQISISLIRRPASVLILTRLRTIPHIESRIHVAAHFLKPVPMRQLEATVRESVLSISQTV